MAERIIVPFVCLLCAFPFWFLGWNAKNLRTPISFFANDEKRLAGLIADVTNYNREMSILYRRYALGYAADAFLSALLPLPGVILLLLYSSAGIYVVYRKYKGLLVRYSK